MNLRLLVIITLLFAAIIIINPIFAAVSLPSETVVKTILQERIDKQKQSVGIVVGLINPQKSKIISYGQYFQHK